MEPVKKKNVLILLGAVLALALAVVGVQVGIRFYTQATQSPEPQKVKISNVSENSFTVSFTTDQDSNTFIAYGATPELGNTASGKEGSLHHIQVKGLRPQTTYFWKIGSGAKQYDKSGTAYQVRTAPIATVPPTPDEAFGKVVDSSGSPVATALVYVTLQDADGQGTSGSSSLLSAQTAASGAFSLDLGNARTPELASRFVYSRETDDTRIEVEAGLSGSALVRIKTSQTQPLADIAVSPVGATTDIRAQAPTPQQQASQETRTEEATPSAEVEEILEEPVSEQEIKKAQETAKPTIDLPVSKVLDPGDTINGTAAPNTTITVTIKSHQPTTVQVATDASGNWSYTLPANFESGGHTITIADAAGNTATDTFTVVGGDELPVAGVSLPTTFSLFAGILLVLLGLLLPRLKLLGA